MNRRLLAAALCTIILMAVVLTGVAGATVSALAGLALAFVLPGYALTKLLFPGDSLELAESAALTLGLSLAVSSLGGLVLHVLPWKLETRSWTVLLGGITLLATAGALWRHRRLNVVPRSFVKVNVSFTLGQVLLFALAGSVVAGAYILAYQGEVAQNRTDFTQLWIQPDDKAASAVVIGINNHATETVRYRLQIKLDQAVVGEISPIELKPEGSWTHSFSLPEGGKAVTAQLFRVYAPAEVCHGNNPPDLCQQNREVYRSVVLQR